MKTPSNRKTPSGGAVLKEAGDTDGVDIIRVVGARVNNLQGLDVDILRHRLTCVCGVSGSGKSTLLFSVLAAESEARHQALLADSRRKHETTRAPADAVTGLPFSVTVSQRVLRAQKRSTVATQTGIHGDLAALVRHFGEIRCSCGVVVGRPSAEALAQHAANKKRGSVRVYSVTYRHSFGGSLGLASEALRAGGSVLKQLDGTLEWKAVPPRGSLQDAIACAVEIGVGASLKEWLDLAKKAEELSPHGVLLQAVPAKGASRGGGKPEWLLDSSREWPCSACGVVHPRATGSLLSFNSDAERSGRCTHCAGLGTVPDVARDLLVENPSKSVLEGALGLERKAGSFRHLSVREDTVRGVIRRLGASEKSPWQRLPDNVKEAVLHGTKLREQPVDANGKKAGAKVLYHGLVTLLVRLIDKAGEVGDYARSFVRERVCPHCGGGRYEERLVRRYEYASCSFIDLLGLSSTAARSFFDNVRSSRNHFQPGEAVILAHCARRSLALERSGLGHLSLGRSTASLSGGELQRLKISRSLVGGLTGACYILDEPSLGLHAADNAGLIENLRDLRNAGNTVIIADHDPDFIAAADTRLYLGPGAGRHGGYLLKKDVPSRVPVRQRLKPSKKSQVLRLEGCTLYNIQDQAIEVPLGQVVCLTGVSGSGKSSFSNGILQPALRAALGHQRFTGPGWRRITGTETLQAVVAVEQQALSRSRRSLVATYVGIMDLIRDLLAVTETAHLRGYRAGTFSCNRPEGWCPACQGLGTLGDEEGQDMAILCDACRGARFRDAVLDCHWKGQSIADLLAMEVADAVDFFAEEKPIHRRLALLRQLGLGHLKLGRSTSNLSGGEAQRLKLASGLAAKNQDLAGLVFILDEPTAGLHGNDVQSLLDLLDQLVAGGRNTVVIVEHDLSVIAASDWVVDFGPGSAAEGGRVVAAGPPAEISRNKASLTGKALLRAAGSLPPVVKASTPQRRASSKQVPSLAAARRFSAYLRQHYADETGEDGDEALSAEGIRPTYVLDDSNFPRPNATLLESFRLVQNLDRVMQPKLTFQPETSRIVNLGGMTGNLEAAAKRYLPNGVRLAWTLASDAIAYGKATRSSLVTLVRHAKEGGAQFWTDETGALHPITDEDFSSSDPFHVCILMEGQPSAALLREGLQLGSGWVRVLERKAKGDTVWSVKHHLVDRPLSLRFRGLAGRALRSGLLPKTSGSACPYCLGKGSVRACEEELLIANQALFPSDKDFYTAGAQSLLAAVFGRMQKTMEFFQKEGLVNFALNGDEDDRWSRQVFLHGYPWARFPIPRKGYAQKVVEYYEWRGLFSVIEDRVHLAKDVKWRARVEASFTTETCAFCTGTGLDWSARDIVVGQQSLPDFLEHTTFASLLALLGEMNRSNALHRFLTDVCDVGLGNLKLIQRCKTLGRSEVTIVRSLAVKHLAFPEAGYLPPAPFKGLSPSGLDDIEITYKETVSPL